MTLCGIFLLVIFRVDSCACGAHLEVKSGVVNDIAVAHLYALLEINKVVYTMLP